MIKCLNCDNSYEGAYCNKCGQKSSTKRITVKAVLKDLPHNIYHVDKGILKNILSMRYPGKTVKEYMQGKRAGFFNPYLLFLLSTGLILFIQHLLHKDYELHFSIEGYDPEMSNDPKVAVDSLKADVGYILTKYLKYIYFGACFLYALPTWLLFRKSSGFNYAENVTANAFILGYVNIIYLPLGFIPFVSYYPVNIPMVLLQLFFIAAVFHKKNWVVTILKSLLAFILQFVLFNFLTAGIGFIASSIKYYTH